MGRPRKPDEDEDEKVSDIMRMMSEEEMDDDEEEEDEDVDDLNDGDDSNDDDADEVHGPEVAPKGQGGKKQTSESGFLASLKETELEGSSTMYQLQ
eukprot:5811704-Pyramimonas_sp.AAC.1